MTGAGVAVLLIGMVIISAEGGMLARGSWEYLNRAYPNPAQAKKVAALVLAPAVLMTIGALLVVATVGIGPEAGIQAVLARVGLVFLATAGMHLGAIMMLNQEKAEVEEIELTEDELREARDQGKRPEPVRRTIARRPKPIPVLPEPLRDPPPDGL
jgi:hypothetical protein